MVFSNSHNALDRDVILRALSCFFGVTTADGNVGGTTLICNALIGLNDFLTNKAIIIQSGNKIFQDSGVTGFNNVTGAITVSPAFSSQVTEGTAFYVLNGASASAVMTLLNAIYDAISAETLREIRPLINLYESWQDEAGIDLLTWTPTDPATGAAWIRGAVGELLMAYSVPNASEFARLRSNQRWVCSPTLYGADRMLRRLQFEFEFHIVDLANLDNTGFFYGLTTGIADTRATNNIIGLGLTGAGNALETVSDAGGAETTNTGFGENLLVTNKAKIDVSIDKADFYLNETLIARHIVNLPDAPMYLNFYAPTGIGGAATVRLGGIRTWVDDIPPS